MNAPSTPPSRTSTRQAFHWLLAILLLGLAAPSVILFCIQVFVGQASPAAAIGDILGHQFEEGHNLFLLAVIGLIPFVLLGVLCLVLARHMTPPRLACVTLGGLTGILALMIPGHVSIWYPLYGAGDVSSTSVIGFIFIPIYCIATLGIGLLIGWLISLCPAFRRSIIAA